MSESSSHLPARQLKTRLQRLEQESLRRYQNEVVNSSGEGSGLLQSMRLTALDTLEAAEAEKVFSLRRAL